jgi:hypothetical protein
MAIGSQEPMTDPHGPRAADAPGRRQRSVPLASRLRESLADVRIPRLDSGLEERLRAWSRILGAAFGVAALAGAGQLGLAYGLGLVWFSRRPFGGDAAWSTQLAWVAWFAMLAVLAGAVAGTRMATRQGRELDFGTRVAVALVSGAGAAVVAPLTALPARAAQLTAGDPASWAAAAAGLGVVVGIFAAVAAMSQRLVAVNLALTVAVVWLFALVSVAPLLSPTAPLPRVRLGVLDLPAFDAGTAVGVLTAPLIALLIGGVIAAAARSRQLPSLPTALSGLAGPGMLALAYVIAGPGGTTAADRSLQLAPYWGALIAVAAGLLAALLVSVVRTGVRLGAHRPGVAGPGAGGTGAGAGADEFGATRWPDTRITPVGDRYDPGGTIGWPEPAASVPESQPAAAESAVAGSATTRSATTGSTDEPPVAPAEFGTFSSALDPVPLAAPSTAAGSSPMWSIDTGTPDTATPEAATPEAARPDPGTGPVADPDAAPAPWTLPADFLERPLEATPWSPVAPAPEPEPPAGRSPWSAGFEALVPPPLPDPPVPAPRPAPAAPFEPAEPAAPFEPAEPAAPFEPAEPAAPFEPAEPAWARYDLPDIDATVLPPAPEPPSAEPWLAPAASLGHDPSPAAPGPAPDPAPADTAAAPAPARRRRLPRFSRKTAPAGGAAPADAAAAAHAATPVEAAVPRDAKPAKPAKLPKPPKPPKPLPPKESPTAQPVPPAEEEYLGWVKGLGADETEEQEDRVRRRLRPGSTDEFADAELEPPPPPRVHRPYV